eukprot:322561-Chlamydomonas_euryale.AAC.16
MPSPPSMGSLGGAGHEQRNNSRHSSFKDTAVVFICVLGALAMVWFYFVHVFYMDHIHDDIVNPHKTTMRHDDTSMS